MMISTEFKQTNNKLGLLTDFSNEITNYMFVIEDDIMNNKKLNLNELIIGIDYIAIILNLYINTEPYRHIIITTLKYSIENNRIYLDLFISNSQLDNNMMKYFYPKINKDIYNIINEEIKNVYSINEKILRIYKYMNINFKYIYKIYVQKNVHQYLTNINIRDDNLIKNKIDDNNKKSDQEYDQLLIKIKKIVKNLNIKRKYVIIATTNRLFKENKYEINIENEHAEYLLLKNNLIIKDETIWVFRVRSNGNIGCGLPCEQCIDYMRKNKKNNVNYSYNNTSYIQKEIKEIKSYITSGNKLLHINKYLYEDYILPKRKLVNI